METLLVINEFELTQEQIAELPVVIKARAVLLDIDGNLVMTYAKDGTDYFRYSLPGGGIEEDESREEALVRECLEETGYRAEIIAELGVLDVIRKTRVSRTYFWLARTVGPQEALVLTQKEMDIFHECKIMPFEKGCEQIEEEYREHGSDVALRSLTALQKAKEILAKKCK